MGKHMNIKKGDTVKVIAGKDKGAQGKVITVLREEDRVIVEGVNLVKRHTKSDPNDTRVKTGGIITQEAAVHVSNVQVVCPSCGKPSRIGHRRSEPDATGKTHSVRFCKRCNGDI